MLFQSIAQELPLSPFTSSFSLVPNLPSKPNPNFNLSFMRASTCSALALFRAISSSHLRLHRRLFIPSSTLSSHSLIKFRRFSGLPASSVEQFVNESTPSTSGQESWDFSTLREIEVFNFDKCAAATDLKHLSTPDLEVKDLSELPEQWRRARLAWLCKELPAHRAGTLVRILNGQKKWMRQDDATYVVVHCMRIRENETGFRVSPTLHRFG